MHVQERKRAEEYLYLQLNMFACLNDTRWYSLLSEQLNDVWLLAIFHEVVRRTPRGTYSRHRMQWLARLCRFRPGLECRFGEMSVYP